MTFIVDGTSGLTFPNSTVQASAGKVLQVVNATYSTVVTNSATTYASTGVSATITPKFSTSKILIITDISGIYNGGNNNAGAGLAIFRDSTNIIVFAAPTNYSSNAGLLLTCAGTSYLDSPATTSSITYSTQFARFGTLSSVQVQADNDTSTITLMEIAA